MDNLRFMWGAMSASSMVLLALSLAACGGGSDSNPAPASATFDLAAAVADSVTSGMSANLDITGTLRGVAVTGTGTFTESAAAWGSFGGDPVWDQSQSVSAAFSDGKTLWGYSYARIYSYDVATHALRASMPYVAATGPVPGYWTEVPPTAVRPATPADPGDPIVPALLDFLGSAEVDVASSPIDFPTMVVVGSAGTLGTMSRYTDATQSVSRGTVEISFLIRPPVRSGGLAVVEFSKRYYDSHQVLEEIALLDYSLSAGNVLTLVAGSRQRGADVLTYIAK